MQEVGHQKGHGAHDRRHHLPAVGGGRLDGCGLLGLEARAFHHGDGDHARGQDVGDHDAVDGAKQRGGQDGDLGRAAAKAAHQADGNIIEEIRASIDAVIDKPFPAAEEAFKNVFID